jgi:hypothetical protein
MLDTFPSFFHVLPTHPPTHPPPQPLPTWRVVWCNRWRRESGDAAPAYSSHRRDGHAKRQTKSGATPVVAWNPQATSASKKPAPSRIHSSTHTIQAHSPSRIHNQGMSRESRVMRVKGGLWAATSTLARDFIGPARATVTTMKAQLTPRQNRT